MGRGVIVTANHFTRMRQQSHGEAGRSLPTQKRICEQNGWGAGSSLPLARSLACALGGSLTGSHTPRPQR